MKKLLLPFNGRVVVSDYWYEPPLWTSELQAVSWLRRDVWSVLRLVDEALQRAMVGQASAKKQSLPNLLLINNNLKSYDKIHSAYSCGRWLYCSVQRLWPSRSAVSERQRESLEGEASSQGDASQEVDRSGSFSFAFRDAKSFLRPKALNRFTAPKAQGGLVLWR
jgi:hypothetical protein